MLAVCYGNTSKYSTNDQRLISHLKTLLSFSVFQRHKFFLPENYLLKHGKGLFKCSNCLACGGSGATINQWGASSSARKTVWALKVGKGKNGIICLGWYCMFWNDLLMVTQIFNWCDAKSAISLGSHSRPALQLQLKIDIKIKLCHVNQWHKKSVTQKYLNLVAVLIPSS